MENVPVKEIIILASSIPGAIAAIVALVTKGRPDGLFFVSDQFGQKVDGVVILLPNTPSPIELRPSTDGIVYIPRRFIGCTVSIRNAVNRNQVREFVVPDFGRDTRTIVIPT